jgi:peptidoglycan/LPS O-acetylase OafA/YrhL
VIALFWIYFYHQDINLNKIFQTIITLGISREALDVPLSWAVAVEFQFYLIFPFLLFVLNKKGIKFLAGFIVFFIFLRLFLTNGNFQYISYWTIYGRIDQFLIGMILGVLYLKNEINLPEKNRKYLFTLSFLLIIFSLYAYNKAGGFLSNDWWKVLWSDYEAIIWALFILSYSFVSGGVPRIFSRIMESLGGISYSIFFTHFIVIKLVLKNNFLIMFSSEDLIWNAFLNTVIIVIPVVVAVSYVVLDGYIGNTL